ncbi:MAG: helix-turn-helix transcriptional regulator [bacterium]|nr:MAG: helix-turn-helix transcriptional regulator [bacterium]
MNKAKIKICSETAVDHQKVRKVAQSLPPENEIVSLTETFKILGDPTRLKIVLALAREELCVCDLATLFSLSVSAISHQLRLLRGMKLVKYRKVGKMVYYSLDDEHIGGIIQLAHIHVREIP